MSDSWSDPPSPIPPEWEPPGGDTTPLARGWGTSVEGRAGVWAPRGAERDPSPAEGHATAPERDATAPEGRASRARARLDGGTAPASPPSRSAAASPAGATLTGVLGADAAAVTELAAQVAQVLLGEATPIRIAIATFLAGGHVLFEDTPGTGKTLLAKALASSIGGSFGRVQGTTDLLPSDVSGVSVFDAEHRTWEFRPGPVFNNVVLVDELNRATPRTQSALLEAMAERQVTVDGSTHLLPEPFFVIATQNPLGDLGTFPLVAGQRDRFTVALSLGQPGREAERRLVRGDGGEPALPALSPIGDAAMWNRLRTGIDGVHLSAAVSEYALDIVDAVRRRVGYAHALSTRAALAMLRVARGHAVLAGRGHVSPDDVQAVAAAALAHRVVDATNGNLPAARQLVYDAGSAIPVPPVE